MKRGRPAKGTEHEARERAVRALALRRAGLNNPQIAARLGMTTNAVPTIIKKALFWEAAGDSAARSRPPAAEQSPDATEDGASA